jgi:hypothetical protein
MEATEMNDENDSSCQRIAYDIWQKEMIDELETARKEGVKLAAAVIGQTLFSDDLFIISLIDKSLRLVDGFKSMIEQRNLTCAGILLRIQIDNCLRTYAFLAAADHQEVIDSMLGRSVQLNRLKAKDGKKMTDQYLREQLEKVDKRFGTVYKEASGYIHHSKKAFYMIASAATGPNSMELDIGHALSPKYDVPLKECAEAFLFFLQCQRALTQPGKATLQTHGKPVEISALPRKTSYRRAAGWIFQ